MANKKNFANGTAPVLPLRTMNEDETIAFRAPKELAAWLKSEAKKEDRKLSEWLRRHFASVRDKRKVKR